MKTDNTRSLMTEDLNTCGACGKPSVAWADAPGKVATGHCGADECRAAIVDGSAASRCYLCHRPPGKGKRETRPYGPNGAPLCAGCMFGEGDRPPDPEIQQEAARQFGAAIEAAEADSADGRTSMIDGSGPPRAVAPVN